MVCYSRWLAVESAAAAGARVVGCPTSDVPRARRRRSRETRREKATWRTASASVCARPVTSEDGRRRRCLKSSPDVHRQQTIWATDFSATYPNPNHNPDPTTNPNPNPTNPKSLILTLTYNPTDCILYCFETLSLITGPPNGPVLFYTLSSVGVVCRL